MKRLLVGVMLISLFGCGGASDPVKMNMNDISMVDAVDVGSQAQVDGLELEDGFIPADVCSASCDGLECGLNACGKSCGECVGGVCEEGVCVACVPSCEGLVCGPDGCGGSCGTCEDGAVCEAGLCLGDEPLCLEGWECGEDSSGAICGSCGNGFACVEHVCVEVDPELCQGKDCGDDGQGGSCGDCPPYYTCEENLCVETVDPCAGKECGDGCGQCEDGFQCEANQCVEVVDPCDGKECGDGCGSCQNGFTCINNTCVEDQDPCSGKECGPGCGSCPAGMACSPGYLCIEMACTPDCAGKVCGADGCGGQCGVCTNGGYCSDYVCVNQCTADCSGKECGPDGCGGTCGQCGTSANCITGICQSYCVPDCDGQTCGPDGCGGQCGVCQGNTWCDQESWTCLPGTCEYLVNFSNPSQRCNQLGVGDGGRPGQALNVDHNAQTCAPSGDCQDGLDNAFAGLLVIASQFIGSDPSEMLQEMVDSGEINLLFEPRDFTSSGSKFKLALYYGTVSGQCNFGSQQCSFLVSSDSFHPDTCMPFVLWDNATVSGNAITAGGLGYSFTFILPMDQMGGNLELEIANAAMEADATYDGQGRIATLSGVIGGAVIKEELIAQLAQIPEISSYIPLISGFLNADIDTDGDGVKDAISIGIPFASSKAQIIGLN